MRVVLGVLSLFAFAWVVVFVQLIAGRDPVLSAQAATATTANRASSSSPPAQRARRRTRLVAVPTDDGVQFVRVPVKSPSSTSTPASTAPAAPAPAPAPLTTSAS